MTDRPILFSAPMVQAILDGRKMQTRRVVKPQPYEHPLHGVPMWDAKKNGSLFGLSASNWEIMVAGMPFYCPYGRPGDRLWVRETWASDKQVDHIKPRDLSHGEPIYYAASDGWLTTGCQPIERGRLRPSIFMMPWMSRIILEITNVRVERLQDISEADSIDEGVPADSDAEPQDIYMSIWNELNGPESWAANPFVWVIEFKRVTP